MAKRRKVSNNKRLLHNEAMQTLITGGGQTQQGSLSQRNINIRQSKKTQCNAHAKMYGVGCNLAIISTDGACIDGHCRSHRASYHVYNRITHLMSPDPRVASVLLDSLLRVLPLEPSGSFFSFLNVLCTENIVW